ncbi:MAG TPA: hypothetical protein VFU54_13860 [Actinomycetota bacterium]|nr:hypothetical protein [Actinomycetota bacterium]
MSILTDLSSHLRRSGEGERRERTSRLLHSLLLAGTVSATLLPAVLLHNHSRIFLAKLAVAALLSTLPGWLYLLFIRFRGRSLYDEYVLNLFRLRIDETCNLPAPPAHTSYYRRWKAAHDRLGTSTKDNLYRHKFETIYGRRCVSTIGMWADRQSARDRTETFSPVLVTTMLLCLGWALVVQPELMRAFEVLGGRLPFSGKPELPYEAIRFGFLGAYWFVLQDVIRRFFRDDLKTGAYISASARIVLVTVTVVTVSLIPLGTPQQKNMLAFLIGVFPQIGLQALKVGLTKPLGRLIPTVRTDHPLSQLDGVTIWDEARLMEEGIEDLQNLASSNLLDILLRSRVPVTRLVDWLDQSFLYLRVPKRPGERSPRDQLRELGIRTATDLERAWAALGDDKAFRGCVSRALNVSPEEGPAVVQAILTSLQGEVNLVHVRAFRAHPWLRQAAGHDDGPPPEAVALARLN